MAGVGYYLSSEAKAAVFFRWLGSIVIQMYLYPGFYFVDQFLSFSTDGLVWCEVE